MQTLSPENLNVGHKDSRMIMRYAHLLPDDLKEAFRAIDNTGTALILSQIYHSGEKEKGLLVQPLGFVGVPSGIRTRVTVLKVVR